MLRHAVVLLVATIIATGTSLFISAFEASGAKPDASAIVTGDLEKWHRLTLSFAGPYASETDGSPNPFLDYRLQVEFIGPGGQTYNVPGFFDGDGNGGAAGNVWRVHFSPDQAGTWTYQASFRQGANVAVDPSASAGSPKSFDGASGIFDVADRDPTASGFLKWGRLEYAGEHYLKFRDGPYWLKGGADSPENWLGYAGFDNTPQARHTFSPHAQDWQMGDPTFNSPSADDGKGLVGALNYLNSQWVNSIYFLPMNIGGDGKDTSPYVNVSSWAGSTTNDNSHFDISKLRQWETAFAHAQRRNIHLHFVLNEAEEANKRELDDATLGTERKLFYREMVARFGHHNALQWNISEEYDLTYPLSPDTVKAFAGYIQQLDPYDHPITVHQAHNPDSTWTPFLGDARFSLTSFQYAGSTAGYGDEVEEWRRKTASAGRPITISMDELAAATTTNADQQRKTILWPTYLSGGQLEWFVAAEDQSLEDLRRYEQHWTYTRHARFFMQQNLPFWEMAPQDGLLSGESSDYGGGQVFAKAGQVYAVYLPNATSSGTLDLSGVSGSFQKRWYNPRTGDFEGTAEMINGDGGVSLGTPPDSPAEDWVVLLETTAAPADTTPPETTIDTGPSGTVKDGSATFTFSSNEAGSTFECSLDGAAFNSCTSPKEYTNLSEGSHTFEVKAKVAAGNTDASPANRTWTIATTAPTIEAVAPADGANDVAIDNNVTATFSEAMDDSTLDGTTFELTEPGSTTPVETAVTYDAASKKATLDPSADLKAATTYTATVKGGATGAKDLAGNVVADDKVWSFKTSSTSPAQGVTGFTLINADTDQPIMPLTNGATINLVTLPTDKLNIRADTNPAMVGSVRFAYDSNSNYRTEDMAPYTLAGDTIPDYYSWTPSAGPHEITATPYTGSRASGTEGEPLTIAFTVTER
jgi:hypothetical protein